MTLILDPKTLSIDVNVDSPDLSDEDIKGAIHTENVADFRIKVKEKAIEIGGPITSEQRRIRDEVQYCLIHFDQLRVCFRINWLRKL